MQLIKLIVDKFWQFSVHIRRSRQHTIRIDFKVIKTLISKKSPCVCISNMVLLCI